MAELAAAWSQFHFLRPWWLLAAVAVVICYRLLRHNSQLSGQWRRVIAPEILAFLMDRESKAGVNLGPWVLAGGLLAVAALAGPTWSKKPVPVHRQEQPLIVLFDLSPSMQAQDIKPDRLTRARLKAIDLLEAYSEGTAALVAYAGDAHVVTPLTDDTNTIVSQLPVLHPNIMPTAGSNPEAALDRALKLAANAGYQEGDIVLITDGVTPGARENLEARLTDNPGFRLSILGIGTAEGAPIPLNEYGFARDARGGIVIAKLNAEELQGLATRSGGVYRTITGTGDDIDALITPLARRSTSDTRALERTLNLWEDRGIWLVLLLLPLAALLFRRGLIAVVLVAPTLHSPDASASFWDDLWKTPDQQGMSALERDRPEEAQQLFEDPAWRGIAAARQGDFAAAADHFASQQNADGHYNRGNALAKAGQLEAAIDAYARALEMDPDMEDARSNKALVEKLLRQKHNDPQSGHNSDNRSDGDPDNSGRQSKDGNSRNQQDDKNGNQSPDSAGDRGNDSGQNGGENGGSKSSPHPQAGPQPGAGGDRNPERPGDGSNKPEDADSGKYGTAPGQQDSPQGQAAGEEDQTDGMAGRDTGKEAAGTASGHGDKDGNRAATTSADADGKEDMARQWLRRVPDDPGGLLRNKFDYESRQRFREERNSPRPPPGQYSEERW